ncbi:MAG TPA: hypothetical protein PKA77_01340 [Chitinophagaceae bacterium]|jgi:hypothetical protein|nr:hypothetical protein [Chitinophagaceae bacterium]
MKITFVLLSLLFSSVGHTQRFSLEHINKKKYCPDFLYAEVDCLMKLKTRDKKIDLATIDLSGETTSVRKVNDSVYSVRPLVLNSEITITVIDNNSYKVIDSVLIRSGDYPFKFGITQLNIRDMAHSYRDIFSQMKRLYFYSLNKECMDYASIWQVISYELVLKRGSSSILRIRMHGNEVIPNKFKQNLIMKFQQEDVLMAQNIHLKNSIGECIRVDSYGVYK